MSSFTPQVATRGTAASLPMMFVALEIGPLGPRTSSHRSALVGGWTYHSLGLFDSVAQGKVLIAA